MTDIVKRFKDSARSILREPPGTADPEPQQGGMPWAEWNRLHRAWSLRQLAATQVALDRYETELLDSLITSAQKNGTAQDVDTLTRIRARFETPSPAPSPVVLLDSAATRTSKNICGALRPNVDDSTLNMMGEVCCTKTEGCCYPHCMIRPPARANTYRAKKLKP